LRLAHVITSLDVGGAERVLVRVARGLGARGFEQVVVSLKPPGAFAEDLRAAGIPIHSTGMAPDRVLVGSTLGAGRLVGLLRRLRPEVVQTWMYHADVVGGVAARLSGIRRTYWNVRHADLPLEGYGRVTAGIARASVPLSRRVPERIVVNSVAGRDAHADRGYPPEKMVVVPNGVPVPSVGGATRDRVRAQLRIPPDGVIVTHVGRFHEQKDHPGLLRAAATVCRSHPEVVFVLCGTAVTPANQALSTLVRTHGLDGKVRLLGARDDVDTIHAATDVAVCSSAYGESFPNAILEAMAAGVPVVTTDVGDCAHIVGGTGRVVPPRDPEALAGAIGAFVAAGAERRRAQGRRARHRVEERFSLERMVERYAALYEAAVTPDGYG
jgi:glycosyltransferase involved in cell wall biosynthesis